MSSWKKVKLSEVAEIIMGQSPASSDVNNTGIGIPLLNGPTEFTDFHPVPVQYTENGKKFADESDLLFCVRGSTTGRMNIADQKYAIGRGLASIKGKNGYTTQYIKIILEQNLPNILQAATGSTFPNVGRELLVNLEVSINDVLQAEKISDFYAELNQKIQLNTQINQTLEQIAQAIFKSWFIDFDPVRAKAAAKAQGATGDQADQAAMGIISGKSPAQLTAYRQTRPEDYDKLAQLAHQFPSELEMIDGVEVPKGWGIFKIDDVIEKIPVGKKYSQKTANDKGNIPVLDQGKSGIIGYHNEKAGVIASIENPVIVFANHTCYMRLISYPFSAIQNVFAFKGKEVNIFWLYLATLGKQEFVEYKGHFPDFLIKQIIVPNTELTKLFGNIVAENFMKSFKNEKENKFLSDLRDLLLPKLLSGELYE